MYNPYNFNAYSVPSAAFGQQMQRQEIVKVNGQNGARAFEMAPNSQAILLDMYNPLVYLVQSDGAGYKTVNTYNITPYTPEKEEDTIKALEDRVDKLEKRLNDESSTPAVKQK